MHRIDSPLNGFVVDVELTLNRFGFRRPLPNKLQIGPFLIAWWHITRKFGLSFEINWKVEEPTYDFQVSENVEVYGVEGLSPDRSPKA